MTPARQKIGGRKPRTRRHLRYRGVHDFLGRLVGRELVNTGKDYRPAGRLSRMLQRLYAK